MNSESPDPFQPIAKHNRRDISAVLKARAERPDVWAAQWPGDGRLLSIHNRIAPTIWITSCRWPNSFFIPEDNMYIILDSGYFKSLDVVEFIMTLEEIFDAKIDDDAARIIHFSSTYGQFLESLDVLVVNPGDAVLEAFRPIGKHERRDVSAVLQARAEHPDVWAVHWASDPKILDIRDRMQRVWCKFCRFPEARFIPDDNLNTILDEIYADSLERVEFFMALAEEFGKETADAATSKMTASSTYGQLVKSLADVFFGQHSF